MFSVLFLPFSSISSIYDPGLREQFSVILLEIESTIHSNTAKYFDPWLAVLAWTIEAIPNWITENCSCNPGLNAIWNTYCRAVFHSTATLPPSHLNDSKLSFNAV